MNIGGTSAWIESLTVGLRGHGIDVVVYAGPVKKGEKEDPAFGRIGANHFNYFNTSLTFLNIILMILSFRRIIKKERPQILNTHTTKAGLIGRISAIGLRVKVVHTFHGHLLYGYFSKPLSRMLIIMERILSKFTNRFIIVGQKVSDELIEEKIGLKTNHEVIYPCFMILKPILNSINEPTRNKDFKITVGWLARLTPIKRPEIVIQLAQKMPDILFKIGGHGKLFEELSLKLPRNVELLGWVDQEKFWKYCDVALLTSANEGIPTSLIEATMSKIPIVASNVGSVSEVFEDGKGGFLCENFESLVLSLEKLANDQKLRWKMGAEAQIYSQSKFNCEKFVLRHIKVYQSIK